ncbi:MAG: prolipoprotein diacylglyceryl transferase [Myxococcota bacterium]
MCEKPVSLFGEAIPPYFAMLTLGFGLAIWLAARWARRTGVDRDAIIDLGLFSILWGVIGARLLHVVADGYFWDYVNLCLDPSQVEWAVTQVECAQMEGVWDGADGVCRPAGRDCFAWAAFWQGGLTYYGGLLAATAFGLWFLRREKLPALKVADMAGMFIPLGLFFGRMGCFLGGCCFGQVTDHAFGLSFPAWSPASRSQWKLGLLDDPSHPSLAVHPTQLYEAFGTLALAAALMLWLHPRKRFDGQVLLAFLGGYAVLRFVLEFWRADDRGALMGLSTSQIIGVVVIAIVVAVWVRLGRRANARSDASGDHG